MVLFEKKRNWRAVIVDNAALQRETYRDLLELTNHIQIVGLFGSANELLEANQAALQKVDFLLIDIDLENKNEVGFKNGIDLAEELWRREHTRHKPILFYTGFEDEYLPRLSKLRPSGYFGVVTRTNFPTGDKLLEIIQKIVDGEEYFGEDIQTMLRVFREQQENAPRNLFTPQSLREKAGLTKEPSVEDVFELNGLGMSTPQIAVKLGQAERWVQEKLNDIYEILCLNEDSKASSEVMKRRAAIIYQTDRILSWDEEGLPTLPNGPLFTEYKKSVKLHIKAAKKKSQEL